MPDGIVDQVYSLFQAILGKSPHAPQAPPVREKGIPYEEVGVPPEIRPIMRFHRVQFDPSIAYQNMIGGYALDDSIHLDPRFARKYREEHEKPTIDNPDLRTRNEEIADLMGMVLHERGHQARGHTKPTVKDAIVHRYDKALYKRGTSPITSPRLQAEAEEWALTNAPKYKTLPAESRELINYQSTENLKNQRQEQNEDSLSARFARAIKNLFD